MAEEINQDTLIQEQDDFIEFGEYQMASVSNPHADSTCWGCRENILNQLAHIDYGGCLYFDIDEESQDETVIETLSQADTVAESDNDE
jgi:hypothetical protein